MSIEGKKILQKMIYMPGLMMNAVATNEECREAFGKMMVLRLKQASFGGCETEKEKSSKFYQPE